MDQGRHAKPAFGTLVLGDGNEEGGPKPAFSRQLSKRQRLNIVKVVSNYPCLSVPPATRSVALTCGLLSALAQFLPTQSQSLLPRSFLVINPMRHRDRLLPDLHVVAEIGRGLRVDLSWQDVLGIDAFIPELRPDSVLRHQSRQHPNNVRRNVLELHGWI